jgi:hypothetical protein
VRRLIKTVRALDEGTLLAHREADGPEEITHGRQVSCYDYMSEEVDDRRSIMERPHPG